MATLNGALTLAERDAVAVRIRKHLNLDVPRSFDVLLDVHGIIAEGVLRLTLRGAKCVGDLAGLVNHAHALAAATRGRLEQHGVAKLTRKLLGFRGVFERLRRARNHRRSGSNREGARSRFGAHRRNRLCWRTNPDQARITHSLGEPLALGEKAVARMNGIGTNSLGDFDEIVTAQIAL